VRLRPEIIDLVGFEIIQEFHHLHRVGQISVMQKKPHAVDVRIGVEVVDPTGIERRRTADDPMNLVVPGQKILRQVGTVLPGDAGDEGAFHVIKAPIMEQRVALASARMGGSRFGGAAPDCR